MSKIPETASDHLTRVRLELLGESLLVRGRASEEHIRELGNELLRRFRAVQQNYPTEARLRLLLLVTLNLLDELHQVGQERDQLRRLLEEATRAGERA